MSQQNFQPQSLEKNPQRRILASWEFPAFVKYKRTKKWYIIAGVIVTLLLVYSVFAHNFLLAVIVIMVVMLLLLREGVEPRNISFFITDAGFLIGDEFYPFRSVAKFSIVYDPPQVKVLYLEFRSKIKPRLSIDLMKQNPNEIRNMLKKYLEEDFEREGETISDALGRWLKI